MNGKQKLWKTAGRIFLFLCILWLVFHIHYREIYENICNANMGTVVLISCMGLSYQIIWGAALYVLMRKRNPQITIRNAVENVYLGFFASIVAFTLGALILIGFSKTVYRLALLLHCVKLMILYGIPFFCLRSTGESALTFTQAMMFFTVFCEYVCMQMFSEKRL